MVIFPLVANDQTRHAQSERDNVLLSVTLVIFFFSYSLV